MYNYKHMGKNYTLYINQEPFADEENKSGLINALLAQYYRQTRKADEPTATKSPGFYTPMDIAPGELPSSVAAFKFCEHNQVLGFCKKGCKL